MRRLMTRMIVFAALQASALLAQSLTGTWQGSLDVGKELRIVMKIATTDKDTLKATMYSIDQGGTPVAASSVTLQGSTVKMTIPGIGGSYEGKLSTDGNSIAGTWTQGPKPLPLNLARANKDAEWTIPEPPAKLKPMSADVDPNFEVATIKPGKPDQVGKGFLVRGRNFSTINTTLTDLITFAYGLHARQVAGGPAWLTSDKWDIAAKPEQEGAPNDRQLKSMLQKLLVERFQLKFHREQKELSVYVIQVAKTGPKLTKSEGDPSGLPGMGFGKLGSLNSRNASMSDFAGLLQGAVLDRPVLDQTKLPGRFDFALNWTPDEFQFASFGAKIPPPPENADAPPDLFKAMQDQLGLKLEATKAPADVLVIDKAEKPSAN